MQLYATLFSIVDQSGRLQNGRNINESIIMKKIEWLLLNAKRAIFQLFQGENKLHLMRWLWRCPLYTRSTCLVGSL